MPNDKNILTTQQKLFCDKYVANKFNGTQAAISAGYSPKGADVIASKLLVLNKVKVYIAKLTQKHYDKQGIDIGKERVLNEIGRLAFSDIRKFFNEENALKDIKDFDDDSAAALAGLDIDELYQTIGNIRVNIGQTKKIKLHSKISALEILAKHHNLYSDAPVNNIPQPFTDEQIDNLITGLKKGNGK